MNGLLINIFINTNDSTHFHVPKTSLYYSEIKVSPCKKQQHEQRLFYHISVGPFMLLEYCPNGQLNDHLATMRNNVNVETMEKLFRFGVCIARGMEYLADRSVSNVRWKREDINVYKVKIC